MRNLTESLSHVYPNEAEDLTKQADPAPEEEEQQGVIEPWHPGVQRLLELNPDLVDTTSTAGPASAAGPTEEIVVGKKTGIQRLIAKPARRLRS